MNFKIKIIQLVLLTIILFNFSILGFILTNQSLNTNLSEKSIIGESTNKKSNNSITNLNSQKNSLEGPKSSKTENNQNFDSESYNNNGLSLVEKKNFPDVSSRFTYVDDGSGVIEHYVDQISNVDSAPENGTHNIFSNLLATDSIYDNVSESLLNETLIASESFEGGFPAGWSKTGAWAGETDRAYDGVTSADFDGGGNPGYVTTAPMDTTDATAIFVEFYFYDEGLDFGEFELDLFDGSSWDTRYAGLDQLGPENTWNLFQKVISDPQYFVSNFQIRWFSNAGSTFEHAYFDLVTVRKENTTNLGLNLEVQFTDFAYFMGSETIAVKTGSFSSIETLSLSYWTGSSWSIIAVSLVPNAWNNFSISASESIFTIKLEGTSLAVNWWEIDSILIRIDGPGANYFPVQSETSDVDFSLDKGSITNFNNAMAFDSVYSNYKEDPSGTANTHSIDLTGGYLSSSSSDHTSVTGTISFWIKYDSNSGRSYGLDGDMEVRISGGSLSIDWGSTGTITSSTLFSTGVWYFNAIVWNENQNNLLFYTASEGSEPSLDSNSLQGSWTSSVSGINFVNVYWGNGKGASAPIDGHLDDLRYYNTDRPINDILSDYNKSLIGNEPALINYYKLDNAYTDATGNNDLMGSGSRSFSTDTPSWELTISGNQLDQEAQWTGLAHFLEEETLVIKTGAFISNEKLLVDFWNGTDWQNIITDLLENSWNNVSIKDYLTSSTFTIRFRDANTSILDNSWFIDAILIHVETPNIPKFSNIFISPLNPNSSVDLTFSYNYFDYQNDPEILSLQEIYWYKNGMHEILYDNLTILPQSATAKGETWLVSIRGSDGQGYSRWENSSSVIIGNSIPSASNLRYNVTQVDTNDDFEIDYTFFDPDNDPENSSMLIVNWYINGQPNSSYNNQRTIHHENTTAGNYYSYEIKVFDGTNYSIIIPAAFGMGISGGFGNTIPVASNLEILPSNPNTSIDLTANYTYYDFDIHPEAGSRFRWFKSLDGINFVLESGYDDQKILPSSATSKGEYWIFEVTPKDLFDFGTPINSSIYKIVNSIPTISNLQITQNPVTTTDIMISWDYDDADSDSPTNNITWFKNDVLQSAYNNKSQFNSSDHQKNDLIYFRLQVFDGENYSTIVTSSSVMILNSIPLVSNIQISSGFDTLYSNNSLDVSWQYFDADFDSQINSSVLIYWYLDFTLVPSLNNSLSVPSNLINKGDRWVVEIYVYDGTDYSSVGRFGPVFIQNSISTLVNVYLNDNASEIYVSSDLNLDWTFLDNDIGDIDFFQNITWYLLNENQSVWIYQPSWNNLTIVNSDFLNKSQKWYALVSVFDLDDWSLTYRTNNLSIVNSIPIIQSFGFKESEFKYFFTENENIEISYLFIDIDKGDSDDSHIKWFLNEIYQPQFDNLTQIYANQTHPGDRWNAQIIAFDGENIGTILTTEIMVIEDIPDFNNYDFYPINDTEGHYLFWFDVTANPVNYIGTNMATIVLDIIVNNSESYFVIAEWNGTHYVYDWQYTNYTLFGSDVKIIAEASTRVNYVGITYLISEYITFNFTLLDTAPPRVKQVDIVFNNNQNPTEITFIIVVEEFGSDIENATIFYLFQSTSGSSTNRLKFITNSNFNVDLEGFTFKELQKINSTHYFVNIAFDPGKSVNILYVIQVSDQSGNINLNAWPDGTNPNKLFQYNPPLLNFTPEELGLFALIVFVIVLVFSFLINKKFRSKEFVGLDKESVMKNIHKLKSSDIQNSVNLYSLGVVISFFDQRHGPLPVLYQPPFLRDNYNKLLELADISFSTGRFVGNFTNEEQSSFTFSFDLETQIKVLSYSFSLNRPEARGGAENLILKIMLPNEVFPLISQFGNQIKNIVFKIHRTLDADLDGKEKEKVGEMLNDIRELVASIALSHLDLYATIELETDESSENSNVN